MDNRVVGILGIASRARKLVSGDAILNSVREKKAKLVLLSADCSENTQKKIQDKCLFYDVPCILVESMLELSIAIGSSHCAAVAVVDAGFAKSIREKIEMR